MEKVFDSESLDVFPHLARNAFTGIAVDLRCISLLTTSMNVLIGCEVDNERFISPTVSAGQTIESQIVVMGKVCKKGNTDHLFPYGTFGQLGVTHWSIRLPLTPEQ